MAAIARKDIAETRVSIVSRVRQDEIVPGVRMIFCTSSVLNERTGNAVRSASRMMIA